MFFNSNILNQLLDIILICKFASHLMTNRILVVYMQGCVFSHLMTTGMLVLLLLSLGLMKFKKPL